MRPWLDASLAHFQAALFLGLVPVAAVTLLLLGLALPIYGRRSDVLPFVATFAVLGSGLGLLLGSSREPAVQVFLPALITLISGLLVSLFPKSDVVLAVGERAGTGRAAHEAVARVVMASLGALLLASVMGAFWGGSIRTAAAESDRRYAEWLTRYETVVLPMELIGWRGRLGLPPDGPGD